MLDSDVRADLRLAVHAFRSAQRRRVFGPAVVVGDLTGHGSDAQISWSIDESLTARDDGLRADLAIALILRALDRVDQPAAWLARAGTPTPHDLDAQWVPVLHRAFATLEVVPRVVAVITRAGWYDPVNDDRATWQRLRVREG